MEPCIILINGFPATGKTTLAKNLSEDLGIPQVGKDQLKEFLADMLGVSGEDWSAILGRTVSDTLISLINASAGKESIIIESAFIAEFTRDKLQDIIERSEGKIIEVYCVAHREERLRRWNHRIQNGQRHAIHTDGELHNKVAEEDLRKKYTPLKVGKFIKVDTTHFGEAEYNDLLNEVKQYIQGRLDEEIY